MSESIHRKDLDLFMEAARNLHDFDRIGFVLFHGSMAEGRGITGSDIDLCVYYQGGEDVQSDFRLRLLEKLPSRFDVQVFQQLPLIVRNQVLGGMPIYVKDKKLLYETALTTIREYESFKPHLMEYPSG